MRIYLLLLFLSTGFSVSAQNLTGIWRGYFQSRGFGGLVTETYKYEVQLVQNGSSFKGVTYSYKDTTFYGKAEMRGLFKSASAPIQLNETKMIEVRMAQQSFACIMRCTLRYEKSGKEEFLEGSFTGYNPADSSLCGTGTVVLRKVLKSDFRPEPFLKQREPSGAPDPRDRVRSTTPARPTTPRPPATELRSPNPVQPPQPKTLTDSAVRSTTPVENLPPKEMTAKSTPAPNALKTRENVLIKTIETEPGEIVLKMYDNGVIDYDTVSVYHNNRLVVNKKLLTASPIEYRFRIDEDNSEQEIIIVAENLGEVPPNTALMIVEAGSKRYEVRVTSTEQKNAKIRFIYRKPEK